MKDGNLYYIKGFVAYDRNGKILPYTFRTNSYGKIFGKKYKNIKQAVLLIKNKGI